MSRRFLTLALLSGSALLAFSLPAGADDDKPESLFNPPATQRASTRTSTRPNLSAVLAKECVVKKDVPYVDKAAEKQKLDLYAPVNATGAPVLLFVHGGEWAKGDKSEVSSKPKFFNENGVIFISVNYRLSGTDKHPAQVNDVAAAIRWAKDHAADFGGDPNKVVIMGHSAGCHLVTLVGLDPRPLATVGLKPTDIKGVVSWSGGAFDLVKKANSPGMYADYIRINFGTKEEVWRDASPVTYMANAATSAKFLFASAENGNPASYEASKEFITGMQKAGGSADGLLLEGRNHMGANHEVGATNDKTGPDLLKFIKKVTE